jgi:hypothetical protein
MHAPALVAHCSNCPGNSKRLCYSILRGNNSYLEWLLPTGNYTVCIETGEQKQQLQYNFEGGKRVVVEVNPPVGKRLKHVLWICLLLAGGGLMLAALWWELTHKHYWLAGGTLLLVGAAALRLYKPWQMLRWRERQHWLYGA